MIKLKSLLQEIISDRVWHLTTVKSAIEIIKSNKFILTRDWFDELPNQPTYYYMSVARSPGGGYYDFVDGFQSGARIMFELDGRRLSNNHKGMPYDFRKDSKSDEVRDEMEDRVISQKRNIENAISYIKSVNILLYFESSSIRTDRKMKILSDPNIAGILKFISMCNLNNIQVVLYDTETRFRSARGGKVCTVSANEDDIAKFIQQYLKVDKIETTK
ncbi:hypothetical protein [Microcystis phage Mel-JY01]